ncbi:MULTISPECIES: hypothetical protein [unclassified Modestobacter]|uniref:hypothetical protein n=1 Tax=unclassified Modestobacter TaxID=2643866 RepID=UPI0022AA01C2|nr:MULTISPECIES: hypothetical protein [unclassified Modestobacter]MCZ2824187.1 hypothetical protein [Modestobacter sp. VKM Ac-2981]MCZ2854285.1 hypothetical protein [Modestobacter sp. VKM Ac-2982]
MTALTDHINAMTAANAREADVIANRRAISRQRNAGVATGSTTLGDAITRATREDADETYREARAERRRLRREGAPADQLAAASQAVEDARARLDR